MGSLLTARTKHINAKGRSMTLQRPTGTSTHTDVTVKGFFSVYKPDRIQGAITEGDAEVSILNAEIAAAGWPGPPREKDHIRIDNRTWTIMGSSPLYEGETLIGHNLWVRGG